MRLAVAYMRYSSDNQNETSIEYQRSAISAYCSRNGIQLVEEYVDEAFSATNDKRPDFQRLMTDAQNKPVWDMILIHDFSRFFRNSSDATTYKNMLKDRDITVVSVTQNLGDSAEATMLERIIDLMNEQYSVNNARATHAGMMVKANKAGHCGGIPPLGYDLDENGQLIIKAHEAEAVRLIFDMVEQNYSYTKIADYLNGKGYRTKGGKPFSKTSFSSILHREKYTGTYTWNKVRQKNSKGKRNSHVQKPVEKQVRIEGGCPQIISPEQFQRVQEKMTARAGGLAESKSRNHYMLGGLKILKCAECGSCLVGTPRSSRGKKYTTYASPKHKSDHCPTREIRTKYVDTMVAKVIIADLYHRTDLKQISRQMKHNDDYQKLEDEKRGVEKAIGNVRKGIEKDYSDTLVERLNQLETEKRTLDRKLAKSKAGAVGITEENRKEVCGKLGRYLMKADDPDAKAYLSSVLKEVVVSNEDVKIKMNIA